LLTRPALGERYPPVEELLKQPALSQRQPKRQLSKTQQDYPS
jgi:hypothetical protein